MSLPRKDTIDIYHVPTTGTQDFPVSADETVKGCLLPLDRKDHVLSGPVEVNMFEVYVDGDVDLREGDKLVVNSVTYFCKHVFNGNFGGLPHKRGTLTKE